MQDILISFFSHGIPLPRLLLLDTIAFGIAALLLGEGYLLGAFLSRRRWLPRKLVWAVNPVNWVIYLALFSLLFPFPMSGISDQHGPLWQMLLRLGGAACFLGLFTSIAITLYWMARRLGNTRPPKEQPMPGPRWASALLVFTGMLAVGVVLGLLEGALFGPSNGFAGALTTVPMPVLGWSLSLMFPVMLTGFILPVALAAPWFGPLSWRIERLPVSRFAQVGALLIGAGSAVLGVAVLLVP
jgi:hypothetical protein